MSRRDEPDIVARRPRETLDLFGHRDAERALLDAYRSGRMAHAWLLHGPHGIGKATLAYRMARFVLAHPAPRMGAVQDATTLDVDGEAPAARRIAAGAHGGLMVLERRPDDKGKLPTVIRVDDARDTLSFFGSTAAEESWRICIVDTADELNAASANALLKIVEEPPTRALFFLVSNAPAKLLPTILSRCRKLALRPLATDDVIAAATAATGLDADAAMAEAADAAEGSVSRALMLMGGGALKLRQRLDAMLAALPAVDPASLHALGDALPLSDRVALAAFSDGIDRWMGRQLRATATPDLPRLARLAEVWDKVGRAARDTDAYNLERRPLVFSVFGWLAEATA